MSSSHPYWAYAPDASLPIPDPIEMVKAVEEGRRAFALEMAVKSLENATGLVSGLDYLNRAKVFEAYLKGDSA